MTLILLGFKYSIDFTLAFFKSLFAFSHKKCHSLSGISEKVQKRCFFRITAEFQKTELDKYATSGVSVFSITSIY